MRARVRAGELSGSTLFWYLVWLDDDEATRWLLAARSDRGALEWLDLSIGVAWGGEPAEGEWSEVASAIAETIESLPSADGLHDALVALRKARLLRGVVARVGRWLARVGKAGDCAVIADWVDQAELEPDLRLALEITLLERGFAELRRTERFALVSRILEHMDGERPERRALALEILLRNEGATPANEDGPPPRESPRLVAETFLAIVERAAGGMDPSRIRDAVSLVGWRAAAAIVFPHTEKLPRLSEEMTRAIVEGAPVPGYPGSAARTCLSAMFHAGLDLPPLRSPIAIRAAIGIACREARPHAARQERLERWARTAAESWFDVFGLCRGSRDGLRPIERVNADFIDTMVDHRSLHGALRAALEPRLARAGKEGDEARAILDAHPDDPEAIAPVVLGLPQRSVRLHATQSRVSIEELTHELERILIIPWSRRIGGVEMSALLGNAKYLELVSLEDERKYELVGHALRIDAGGLEGVLRDLSGEVALATAALYVVHELVHGAQNLEDKQTVDALRATGGENALMHLDLAADHATALLVHHALPTWTVEQLKERHCIASRAFPVREHHTAAARARKVGRVLNLRVDYLLRRHEIVSAAALGDGYAFAELGPAGGQLVVLRSGPPLSVLGHTPLSPEDAEMLARVADEKAPTLEDVDARLIPLLRDACRLREQR